MKLLVFLFFEIFILTLSVSSQTTDNRMNVDSVFLSARKEAINGNYERTIDLTKKILANFPDHTDARLLLARTCAWQQKFDEAIKHVSLILKNDSSNYEANSALIDFYLWSSHYNKGLEATQKALSFYPQDIGLKKKEMQIYIASKEYEAARKTFKEIKKTNPDQKVIAELKQSLCMQPYSNIFSIDYNLESFNKPYHRRWHICSVGYGRKTSMGTFFGKLYFGDAVYSGEKILSKDVSTQYALELYPRINQKNYFYLNYAFSRGTNFPRDKTGIEYYHLLGKKFEVSLGHRYLYFNPDDADKKHIHIYTASVSKYLRKYWISFRPFIVSDGTDISNKYVASFRRFFKEENYIGLTLGTGTSPDNPAFYTNGENIPKLGAWRGEISWKQRMLCKLIFEIGGSYEEVEYVSNSWREQLAFRASLSYIF